MGKSIVDTSRGRVTSLRPRSGGRMVLAFLIEGHDRQGRYHCFQREVEGGADQIAGIAVGDLVSVTSVTTFGHGDYRSRLIAVQKDATTAEKGD